MHRMNQIAAPAATPHCQPREQLLGTGLGGTSGKMWLQIYRATQCPGRHPSRAEPAPRMGRNGNGIFFATGQRG